MPDSAGCRMKEIILNAGYQFGVLKITKKILEKNLDEMIQSLSLLCYVGHKASMNSQYFN